MDEQQDNEQQIDSVPESATPGAGAGAPAEPHDGDMPMLAGNAAARLTQQILSRLSSPFAVPSASPVRPGALWRQVARRLGVAPDERSRPGPGRSRPGPGRSLAPLTKVQTQQTSRAAQDPFGLEPPELVWRATTKESPKDEPSVEERLSRALRPATQPVLPFLIPPQTPPAPVQATQPVQAAPAPATPQPAISVSPTPAHQPATSEQLPVQAVAAPIVQPPAPPAKVVSVEYVQGPAALPVQPLVSHAPLVEEPSFYAPRNLADTLYRDLVPTTDMISRMARTSWEDMPLPEGRPNTPVSPTSSTPVADLAPTPQAVQQVAVPEQRAVPSVMQAPALPIEEAPRLEMPLAATPTTPIQATSQRAPAPSVAEALEQAQRSPVRQLIDRVATALPLPEAVRRFITGEPTPTERQTPPPPPGGQPTPTPAPTEAETTTREAQRQIAPAMERATTPPADSSQIAQPVTATQANAQPGMPAPVVTAQPAVASRIPPTSAQPTAVAVTSPQLPVPTPTIRVERAPSGIVPAPTPASAPQALDMPVRAPSSSTHVQAQQAEAPVSRPQAQPRSTQPEATIPASPLGPFQAFQPAEQPQESVRQAQPVEPQQQTQQVEPLGPFQPFQPAQSNVVTPQAQPSETPVQTQTQSTISVQPSHVEAPAAPATETRTAEPPTSTSAAASAMETVAPVQRAEQAAATQGEEIASPVTEPTPPAPVSSPAHVREVPSAQETEPRGFLGSLFGRLFGRGEREAAEEGQEQPRTPALEMPWVRRGRAPRTQQVEPRTLSEVEVPATRMAEQPAQAPATPPVLPVTTSAPSPASPSLEPAPIASPLVLEAQPQPQQPVQTAAAPSSSVAAPSTVEPTPTPTSSSSPATTVQPTMEVAETPVAATQPASFSASPETPVAHVEAPSDAPDLPRVLAIDSSPGAPPPLDMPHALPALQSNRYAAEAEPEDILQRAILPSQAISRPFAETPAEVPPPPPSMPTPIQQQSEPAFAASEPAQAQPTAEPATPQPQSEPAVAEAPQAWTMMPDMAEGVARSHAPISSIEPVVTAAQSDLLARILGSLGNEVATATTMSLDLPRAVPAPPTGVGTDLDLPFARPAGPTQEPGAVAEPTYPAQPAYASSLPASTPTPIGLPASPMVSRPQFMPEGLRDIRTTSNQPAVADSVARAVPVPSETVSASAAPEPVAMTPRYITNVTPSTYLAEANIAGAQTGGSPLGTIMHPASHMSPSMADYGWPGDDGSPVTPSVMLPLSEMSPTAESYARSDAEPGEQPRPQQAGQQEEQAPWMEALQTLYGPRGEENMPLAIPYGAFALPSETTTAPTPSQASGFGQSYVESWQGRPASQGFSSLQMPTPSVPMSSFQSGGDMQSYSQPSGFSSSSSSWSTDGMSDSSGFSSWSAPGYSDGDSDSEAGAWADVVASAVSGGSDGGTALALAGEERGSAAAPQAPAEPSNTQDGGKGANADLDELAESVLDIIRNKIVIERERNFG